MPVHIKTLFGLFTVLLVVGCLAGNDGNSTSSEQAKSRVASWLLEVQVLTYPARVDQANLLGEFPPFAPSLVSTQGWSTRQADEQTWQVDTGLHVYLVFSDETDPLHLYTKASPVSLLDNPMADNLPLSVGSVVEFLVDTRAGTLVADCDIAISGSFPEQVSQAVEVGTTGVVTDLRPDCSDQGVIQIELPNGGRWWVHAGAVDLQ